MLEMKFFENGIQFGDTIRIPSEWALSEYKTYEKCYRSGHLTEENRPGYSYSIWLERPLTITNERKK